MLGRRRVGALAAGWLLLATAYLYWGVSGRLLSFGGDNATYLLIAQDLSPFGESSPGAAGHAAQRYYPPLYSVVLAATGAAHDLRAAHAVTVALLLLAFVALFAWCRELDFGPGMSAALTLAYAATRGTALMALEVLSEPLYLLLALAALASVQHAQRRKSGAGWWLAAIAIGAATLTRSAALALLVAYLVALAIHRPRRALWMALLAAAPAVAWMKLGGNADYGSVLAARYRDGGLTAIWDALASQLLALWSDWLTLFGAEPTAAVRAAAIALAVTGGATAVARALRGHLDALYLGAYVALIVVWPFPGEMARFLVMILPVVLLNAALGLREALAQWAGAPARRWIGGLAFASLAAVLVPESFALAGRFTAGAAPEVAELRRSALWYEPDAVHAQKVLRYAARLEDALRRVATQVPAHQCVYSVKPSLVSLFAERRAIYPPPGSLDDDAFRRELDRHDCHYFLLLGATTQSAPALYPQERLGSELTVLDTTYAREGADAPVVSTLARWNRSPDTAPPR